MNPSSLSENEEARRVKGLLLAGVVEWLLLSTIYALVVIPLWSDPLTFGTLLLTCLVVVISIALGIVDLVLPMRFLHALRR